MRLGRTQSCLDLDADRASDATGARAHPILNQPREPDALAATAAHSRTRRSLIGQ